MWNQRKKIGADEYDFYQMSSDSGLHFSEETTPIILAAQKNMFKIVQLLLDRGEFIHIPHKYNCQCTECLNRVKFDHLRAAKIRLNSYKGLASEAYISLSSKDPILRSFTLSKELRHMADMQKFFKKDYNELAAKLSSYVVLLLDQIQTQEELELIVNKVGKSNEEHYEQFGRLKLALRYGEKKFVSHPSIQQKLDQTWYAGQHRLEHSALPQKILGVILIVLFYPILLGCYLIQPKSRLGTIISYPCIKFICHSLSFTAFITLIILSTLEMSSYSENKLSTSLPDIFAQYNRFCNTSPDSSYFGNDFPLRKCNIQPMEMLLIVFIVGFIVQELQQIYEGGLCEYSYSYSNIMDFAMLSLYTMCFSLRFCILFKRQQSTQYLQELSNGTIDFMEKFYDVYWLNADRYYWNKDDPENVAEALFAVANILSFARISYILPANATLGPLQISIGRMVKEILKFFLLFCLVLAAFIVGLQNLYFISTFRTAFWSLFGRGEPHAVQLGDYDNSFTEDVGYVIYGIYNIAMVTVLLNMLIAMMTRSFENIATYSDAEWKYARSLLYMEYMDDSLTLPVPFNILTVLRAIFSVFCSFVSYFRRLCKHAPHSSNTTDCGHCPGVAMQSKSGQDNVAYEVTDENSVSYGQTVSCSKKLTYEVKIF
ncbi:short transient receptor potential channel 7 [Octopus bimaculoides]|uniref:short transient receptor potential channel 7 n=1 Tax=Octopus bimaculoides TaxID=37653 RepID=UPI0022E80CD5|nr:short transient receptor potential channel 7 [Octopus bimaculoides]